MKTIENAGKITLHPPVMYGFKETDFHRICSYPAKYFGYFMYVICTKPNGKIRKCVKITLGLPLMYGANCNEFHESHSCRMTSLGDLLYRIHLSRSSSMEYTDQNSLSL